MPLKNLSNLMVSRVKALILVLSLLPLFKLGVLGYLDQLGANPIEKLTRSTGYWTLTLLMLGLSLTPIRLLLGWLWAIRVRRMLGLFAFFYASLHFLCYLVLDQFFDWAAIAEDILKRPYITVGFPAFLMLIPLAITSTNNMIHRLGGQRWRNLHKLVYLIAVGGVIHYWWLIKKDLTNPITFAAILLLLFGIRLKYRMLKVSRK